MISGIVLFAFQDRLLVTDVFGVLSGGRLHVLLRSSGDLFPIIKKERRWKKENKDDVISDRISQIRSHAER